MNPVDFLNVANELHTAPDEAKRRTSISRSYYATYHVLVQSLSTQGVHFSRTGDDHGQLIHYLVNSGDHRTQTIGGNLRSLRSVRRDADYDLRANIEVFQSQLAYQTADRTIRRFNKISTSDLQNIANAIKASSSYTPP